MSLFHQFVHDIAASVHQHQRVLKLLLNFVIRKLFVLAVHDTTRSFLVGLFVFVLDHVVEKLQVRHVELTHLLEDLLDVQVAEFGEVFVEVFWDGFARGFGDRVPFDTIKVFWQGDLIHDEVVLHDARMIKLKELMYEGLGKFLFKGFIIENAITK